jgi:hypothetical protein
MKSFHICYSAQTEIQKQNKTFNGNNTDISAQQNARCVPNYKILLCYLKFKPNPPEQNNTHRMNIFILGSCFFKIPVRIFIVRQAAQSSI